MSNTHKHSSTGFCSLHWDPTIFLGLVAAVITAGSILSSGYLVSPNSDGTSLVDASVDASVDGVPDAGPFPLAVDASGTMPEGSGQEGLLSCEFGFVPVDPDVGACSPLSAPEEDLQSCPFPDCEDPMGVGGSVE